MATGDPNRNLVAAISYFGLFITGLVVLFVEKQDKFIRFHAMQSVIVFGVLMAVNILVEIVLRGSLGVLTSAINVVISIVVFVVWLVSMIKAFQGQVFKWPIAGDFAEKQVK